MWWTISPALRRAVCGQLGTAGWRGRFGRDSISRYQPPSLVTTASGTYWFPASTPLISAEFDAGIARWIFTLSCRPAEESWSSSQRTGPSPCVQAGTGCPNGSGRTPRRGPPPGRRVPANPPRTSRRTALSTTPTVPDAAPSPGTTRVPLQRAGGIGAALPPGGPGTTGRRSVGDVPKPVVPYSLTTGPARRIRGPLGGLPGGSASPPTTVEPRATPRIRWSSTVTQQLQVARGQLAKRTVLPLDSARPACISIPLGSSTQPLPRPPPRPSHRWYHIVRRRPETSCPAGTGPASCRAAHAGW